VQLADLVGQRLRGDDLEPAAAAQQVSLQVGGGAQGEFEVGMVSKSNKFPNYFYLTLFYLSLFMKC